MRAYEGMQFNRQRVLVMGLGVHGGGLGVARWLLRQGARLTVTDLAPPDKLAGPLKALEQATADYGGSITYVLGEHRAEDFHPDAHDMLVVNPAVPPTSRWLALARANRLPIETDMTIFFRLCPGPILGITGTKGKTTTTVLVGAMLRQQHPDTLIAGNLRVSAIEALDTLHTATPVVLELSSFQLMGLGAAGLSPQYAAVTNLSPDHLNYHGTMEAYSTAKQQIFCHQAPSDTVILNQTLLDEYPDWAAAARAARGTVATFSTKPGADTTCGITAKGDVRWRDETLLHRDELQLPGAHNTANLLAAVALARSFGITIPNIRAAVRGFAGVEHRLESVRTHGGVRYINDTAATNPTAAIAAIESFTEPLVLLAGGADKRLPTEAFSTLIAQRIKAVVLLAGTATAQIAQQIAAACAAHPRTPPLVVVGPYDDFAAAIRQARDLAAPGDVVLLSPGCASFGMFSNEFQRGDEFRRIVREELD